MKKVGAPWLGRSLVSGSERQSSRTRARASARPAKGIPGDHYGCSMVRSHRTAELRSIAFHGLVAERLDDEAIASARSRVDGWLTHGGPVPGPSARRWRSLLARRPDELAAALTQDTEEMRDLRQNTPFAGTVSPEKRWRIVREIR